jgi:hypothetical protein
MKRTASSLSFFLSSVAVLRFVILWIALVAPQLCSSWFIPSSSSSSSRPFLGCSRLLAAPPTGTSDDDGWRLDDGRGVADTYDDNDDDERGGVDSTVEAWYKDLDILVGDDTEGEGAGLYGADTLDDWIPDAEVARKRGPKGRPLIPAKEVLGGMHTATTRTMPSSGSTARKDRPSPYTEEEEELIHAMGGQGRNNGPARREDGFLGDSTLYEIAMDYSVPLCYLADVLTIWGVSVPINVHDRLGDLITGEQAFALVEAVNSLDVGALQDRYSNLSLLQICDEWDIDLKDAFEFAMKEGWSLPFGVRTNLRVEQEEELLRVYSPLYRDVDDD